MKILLLIAVTLHFYIALIRFLTLFLTVPLKMQGGPFQAFFV